MLDFSLAQNPFRFGLAEGTDPHQVPPGTLTTAENVVWKQSGRAEKRFGTSTISNSIMGGGSIAAGARLFTRGTELCLVDGTSLYAYSAATSTWRSGGKVPDVAPTWTTLVDSTTGVGSSDVAYASGLIIHAWTTGDPNAALQTNAFVQVLDQATGAVLVAPTLLVATSTFGVRVLVIGSTAIVLVRQGAASPYAIYGYTVNLSTLAVSAGTSLRVDVADAVAGTTAAPWDACVIGSTFVLGYNRTGRTVALESYNSSLVSQAHGSIVDANGAQQVSIDGASGEVLYVLYAQDLAAPAPIRIAIADPATLTQTVAPVTITTPAAAFGSCQSLGVCRFDASNCVAAFTLLDGTGTHVVFRTDSYKITSGASVTTNTNRRTWSEELICRPFMQNGKCYAVFRDRMASNASTVTALNSYLVEAETSALVTRGPHRLVGTIDPLIGGGFPQAAPLPNGSAVSSTVTVVTVPYQASVSLTFSNWRQGMRLVSVSTGASLPSDMWRSTLGGQEVYCTGGQLVAYDGRLTFDYGFARPPFIELATTSAAGGSIAAGTYLYGAVQEFRSSAGVLHRSPTAIGVTLATTGATSTNTIVVAGHNIETKQNPTTGFGANAGLGTALPVYRSVVAGATLQRLTFEPGFNTMAADQTAMDVSLADTRLDASIDGAGTTLASRPAIYTTGGILDDYAPPSGVTMFHHADRLWVLAGDQRTWWYSKAFQDDLGTAPGFHPSFRISFDETQTAGATMDDKAVFFSAQRVRYMLGTGPAANGANSDFQPPTVIQTDVGCTNARSVVSMPDGVMFLSDRGIYLLTRGLELVWIGRPVKDTLALFPTVTSATLVAKQNQVRFTCNNTGGTAGAVLVFDYVEKQWSVHRYSDNGGVYGMAIADACMWSGSWAFCSAAGVVYVENATSYLDADNYWVPLTLETAWLSATGPLSFHSVRAFSLHGTSYTDHDLTISVGFDSDASYPQTLTFAATGAVTSVGVEECEVAIGTRRKCQAIRFKVNDATPTAGTLGSGRGPAFDTMGIEVGVKRGFGNTPATKKG